MKFDLAHGKKKKVKKHMMFLIWDIKLTAMNEQTKQQQQKRLMVVTRGERGGEGDRRRLRG